MWGSVLGWPTLSVIIGGLVGLAFGVLSLAPPEFNMAKVSFTLAAVMLLTKTAAWVITTPWAVGDRLLFAFLVFGVVGTLFVESWRWVEGRRLAVSPQAATAEPVGPSFRFKDSPLFTDERKARISRDLTRFKKYLIEVGFDVPSGEIPIEVVTKSKGRASGHQAVISGAPRYLVDSLSLEAEDLDNKRKITDAYGAYIISRLLLESVHAKRRPADEETLHLGNASIIIPMYFNWSFWGEKATDVDDPWVLTLWGIRKECGSDFTDRLIMTATKAFVDDPTRDVKQPFNAYFYSRLKTADGVVDSEAGKLPAIERILQKYGRIPPGPVTPPVATNVAFCYLNASLYHDTNTLTFRLMNDTDHPVKELQLTLVDQGAVARYLKGLKTGESPTEQGIEAAQQPISIGPMPTILPHTATELRQLRKDISGRGKWAFRVHMQTDSHLFSETIYIQKLAEGGLALSEILILRDPKKGDVRLWEHTNSNFPKDFVVE